MLFSLENKTKQTKNLTGYVKAFWIGHESYIAKTGGAW